MKWEMVALPPTPYSTPNSNPNSFNWLLGDNDNNNRNTTRWTPQENKLFENALAVHDKDTPDRWHKVAAMIPGKTIGDVMRQYRELEVDVCNIEAGLIPVPGNGNGTSASAGATSTTTTTSPFTLDWVNTRQGYDGFSKGINGKRSPSARPPEQERKKGVPWTEEEHKLFLLGLKKYGKGDWRNISRNFVITRTPTQVASHAQKFFIRQLSGGKDKRRASIHDITTVNVTETGTSSEDTMRSVSPQHSMMLSQQQQPNSSSTVPRSHFQWNNQPNGGVAMALSPTEEKVFTTPYCVNPYGVAIQGQNQHKSTESSYLGPQTQNMGFPMQQCSQHYSHS